MILVLDQAAEAGLVRPYFESTVGYNKIAVTVTTINLMTFIS